MQLMTSGRSLAFGVRGFTLIELLAVLTLFGVLFALALPAFANWVVGSQVRSTAEALQTGLRVAQAESLRRNRVVVLSFADGNHWSAQAVAQLGDTASAANRIVGGGPLAEASSGVTIASASAIAVSAICFNSSGRVARPSTVIDVAGATCAQAPITLLITKPHAKRLQVTVAAGGQVRMCDPDRPPASDATPDGCVQ
jgi:type IV fimbrial biogenesis protein FimT